MTSAQPRPARRQLWLAFVSGAFGLALTAQVNFLVPLRARELGASFDVIGLIVATGAFAPALVSVPLGALIDRFGPRRSFIVGTGCAAGLGVLYLLVGSYWWFLALQPVLGVARNLGWVASQAYVTSLASDETRPRLTGRFAFFGTGGQMLGPVLVGGMAQLAGFRWAFVFLAGYALAFTLVGLALPEVQSDHRRRARQGTGLRSAGRLLAVRGMQVALLLTFARLWITWVYTTFYPVYLVDSGLQPGVVGTVMATSGLLATALGPTSGFWIRRLSQQAVTAAALGCGALGLLLAPHVAGVPAAYLVPILVGIGQGLSLPLLLGIVATVAPAEMRGMALGLRAMVNQTAATAAPVLVGPVITAFGISAGFATGAGIGAITAVVSRVLHVRDRSARDRHG